MYAAYTWLTGQTRPEKIVIGGDSAGGDLAFALLVKLRDNAPELLPAGAIGMSPWVDVGCIAFPLGQLVFLICIDCAADPVGRDLRHER